MISAEKNPLTPRETAMRMLKNMHDDVSYADVIRQLRVLQEIEDTLNDVEMAGFPAEEAVEEAKAELDLSAHERALRNVPRRSSNVLRSRPRDEWRSLAEQARDSLMGGAEWRR